MNYDIHVWKWQGKSLSNYFPLAVNIYMNPELITASKATAER